MFEAIQFEEIETDTVELAEEIPADVELIAEIPADIEAMWKLYHATITAMQAKGAKYATAKRAAEIICADSVKPRTAEENAFIARVHAQHLV